jgi:hypothetical protein
MQEINALKASNLDLVVAPYIGLTIAATVKDDYLLLLFLKAIARAIASSPL